MRVPRDIGAENLISLLHRCGCKATRQTGSHVRLTTEVNGEHHITIPKHKPLRVGTLQAILKDIADHLSMDWREFSEKLFGRSQTPRSRRCFEIRFLRIDSLHFI